MEAPFWTSDSHNASPEPSRQPMLSRLNAAAMLGRRALPNHWDLIALGAIMAIFAAVARAYHGISMPLPPCVLPLALQGCSCDAVDSVRSMRPFRTSLTRKSPPSMTCWTCICTRAAELMLITFSFITRFSPTQTIVPPSSSSGKPGRPHPCCIPATARFNGTVWAHPPIRATRACFGRASICMACRRFRLWIRWLRIQLDRLVVNTPRSTASGCSFWPRRAIRATKHATFKPSPVIRRASSSPIFRTMCKQ